MPFRTISLAAAAAVALAACGGGDDGPRYEALVSFGDSLSDVGTYRTAGIAALGGGKYTVNGPNGKIWIEYLAEELDLPAPCAAQTGLQATGDFAALAAPVANHAGCTAYGQGGSRVTHPIGPWNAALLASPDPQVAYTGQLGQLTVPVVTQVATHLAKAGGTFSGKELVLVLAGGNDVFVNLDAVGKTMTPEQAALAMAQAGAELAALVKTQIVGKGAKRVVVVNLPNVAVTPGTLAAEAAAPGAKALTEAVGQAFNGQLAAGLAGVPEVMVIDLYGKLTTWTANPAVYGFSNATTPACVSTWAPQFLGSSLTCTTSTTVAGDVSRYMFADTVHPTPYTHRLLADAVEDALKKAGWD